MSRKEQQLEKDKLAEILQLLSLFRSVVSECFKEEAQLKE